MELTKHKKENFIHQFAIAIMCVYTLLIYLSYMHGALNSLHSLCLYGMAGLAIILVIIDKKIYLTQHFLWYGSFIFLMLFYVLFTGYGMATVVNLITVLVFTFSLSVIIKEKKQLHLFFLMMMIGATVLILYLIFTGQTNLEEESAGRFGGNLTGNSNIFAAMYMLASIVTIYFLFLKKNKILKVSLLVVFGLSVYALILAGGRKYILSVIIFIYLMFLQKQDKNDKKHILKYTIIFAIVVVLLYVLILNVPFLYDTIGYRFEGLVNYAGGDASNTEGVAKRGDMIAKGLELWLNNPIFGNGIDGFKNLSGFGYYSHNNFIELLCNFGIVGFGLYYGMYVHIFTKLLKVKEKSILKKMFCAFMICLCIFEISEITYSMHIIHAFLVFINLYVCKKEEWEY